ncbi:hypothetical protein KDAU_14230 [Dictyobacter aurantiacus]|uniref:Uncharacterized protein n=1 Tax=Dictyobacter aurantiacus TaxID=1936993 RepID=A0A401ZB36_9CHLR|nr:hypothetical protein KDAU_14230 [Dictyobacter aurantiacus]
MRTSCTNKKLAREHCRCESSGEPQAMIMNVEHVMNERTADPDTFRGRQFYPSSSPMLWVSWFSGIRIVHHK